MLNWFIRVDDQASPCRLATAFHVTRGAMTNTLGKLSAKGFVHIAAHPDSGRSKIVTLTPAGRRARLEAISALSEDLRAFLQAFPAQRLNRALPLLQEARAYLDAARD